jgi:hypothetical protein
MKKIGCFSILILVLISQTFAMQFMLRPQEANVQPGAGLKFELAMFNDNQPVPMPMTAIKWQVIPETLGKLTEDGFFMAGREPGVGAVVATLTIDNETITAKAQVTVGQPAQQQIKIVVRPENAAIAPNGQETFTVYAYGPDGVALQTQSVRWLVDPSNLGMIRPDGLFTAGGRIGEGRIIAAIEIKEQLYKGSASILISPPAKSAILGVVQDENGVAVANASISATRIGVPAFTQRSKTDDKGDYKLGKLISGLYVVKAEAPGFLAEYYKNAATLMSAQPIKLGQADTAKAIDFSLPKGGVITGVVATTDNKPLSGAHVYASLQVNAGVKIHGMTDMDGIYKLEGLPSGSYIVFAQKEGFLAEVYKEVKRQSQATPVKVNAPETTNQINFTLDITSAIVGIITDEKDGTPIAGAMVFVQPLLTEQNRKPEFRGSAKTDEQGAYTVQLVPGIYLVRALARGFAEEYFDNAQDPLNAKTVTVTGPEHVQINMALTPLGSLSGLVADEQTGTPVADAKVRLFSERKTEKRYFETMSDKNGLYSFAAVPEDEYVVQAEARGYLTEFWQEADSVQKAVRVPVKNGNAVVDINLTLSIGAALKGMVVQAPDKTPIKEAMITVISTNGRIKQIAKSQADGSWNVGGLPAGKYQIMATAPGYGIQWYDGMADKKLATVVEVEAAIIREAIDFMLSRIVLEGATISGVVTDDSTSLPVQNATVTAMPILRLGKPRRAVTDADGKYEIAGIAAGTYVLTAGAKGYIAEYYDNTPSWKKAKSIRLAATDKITDINIGLAPQQKGGYMIAGKVTAKTGEESAYALVNVTVANLVVAAAICEEDGQYALSELPSDGYQVMASTPGYVDTSLPSNTSVTVGSGKNTYNATITMIEEVVTGINMTSRLPQRFSMEQNYPNPFNPTTEIHFNLAQQANVTLVVYNLIGQVVRTLYDGVYSTGAYKATWDGLDQDGRRMASGLYLYRLHAVSGNQTFDQTKRMIMMK